MRRKKEKKYHCEILLLLHIPFGLCVCDLALHLHITQTQHIDATHTKDHMDVGHFMATDGATGASIKITSVEMPNDTIVLNIQWECLEFQQKKYLNFAEKSIEEGLFALILRFFNQNSHQNLFMDCDEFENLRHFVMRCACVTVSVLCVFQ